MDLSDDEQLVHVPDYDPNASFDGIFFDTDSSSNNSMTTLSTGEAAEYFHLVHGFYYTSDDNIPRVFPVQLTSGELAAAFHCIVRLSQDGMNVSPEADEVLRAGGVDGSHKGARVLDLHTSCGKWVQEMTKIYPNATFVSVDIKPLVAHMPHANVSFEVYDLYAGIAEPSSSFDVVHARQCVTLTKDFNLLLREMHRVLKPNGILVITEIPIQAYEVDRPYELLHSAPRQAAGLRLVRKGLVSQGIDINAWDEMTARLKPDHLLWAERTFNAEAGIVESRSCSQHTRGFHCIKLSTRLVPSGSWHENETQQMIGCLARSLFIDTWDALVPLMLMMGMDEAEARAVVDGALEELVGGKAEAYLKCHRWTAMKL